MPESTSFPGQHVFAQLANLCPRSVLQPVINGAGVDRYVKHFFAYDHFMTMLYCAVSGASSLREICSSLTVSDGKMSHLGLLHPPTRNTLSQANMRRDASVFEKMYHALLKHYQPLLQDSKNINSGKRSLFLIDSTVFSLFKAILKTTGRHRLDGRSKGGIKKNTVLDGSTLMPVQVCFSSAATNDQRLYDQLNLNAGALVVFDKGYFNYAAFARFCLNDVHFVTRLKEGTIFETVEDLRAKGTVLARGSSVVDEKISFPNLNLPPELGESLQLRRILWCAEGTGELIEFLTNDFGLKAAEIAQLYKYRWQIELFFKRLKQNFPLRYFVGDNQNAIEIQIWCCLIANLLLTVLHKQHKSKLAYSVFMVCLRLHLFTYISIARLVQVYQRDRWKKPGPNQKTPDLFDG